jgi:hypothetical protein
MLFRSHLIPITAVFDTEVGRVEIDEGFGRVVVLYDPLKRQVLDIGVEKAVPERGEKFDGYKRTWGLVRLNGKPLPRRVGLLPSKHRAAH